MRTHLRPLPCKHLFRWREVLWKRWLYPHVLLHPVDQVSFRIFSFRYISRSFPFLPVPSRSFTFFLILSRYFPIPSYPSISFPFFLVPSRSFPFFVVPSSLFLSPIPYLSVPSCPSLSRPPASESMTNENYKNRPNIFSLFTNNNRSFTQIVKVYSFYFLIQNYYYLFWDYISYKSLSIKGIVQFFMELT